MQPSARTGPADGERAFGRDLVFLIVIQFLWGTNWITSKIALAEIPPLALMVIRFAVVNAVFVAFMRWHRGQMAELMLMVLLSGAFHFGLGFYALSLTHDIAPLAIAGNLSVPFATLLSALFLGDKIGIWRGSALVVAFGGIVVMSFDPALFDSLWAMLINTIAALGWSVGAILMRRMRGITAFDMQGWIALGTWPPLLVASALFEPNALAQVADASLNAWLCVAYIIIAASLIGHAGFNWLVQRHPIPRLAPFLLLAPIIGSVMGVLWLGDSMTWRIALGGLLTLSGVFVIIVREGRRVSR
jgi:O-acetylserine/cysteine efflux transporter